MSERSNAAMCCSSSDRARLAGLGELVRDDVFQPGPRPLQRALDRRVARPEHRRDLVGAERQHVAEDQDRPLAGGEALQGRDQSEPKPGSHGGDRRGVVGLGRDQRVGERLEPANSRSGRRRIGTRIVAGGAEPGRQHSAGVVPERRQRRVGGDLVQPGSHG